MTDPYSGLARSTTPPQRPAGAGGRPALWLLLAVSLVLNVVTSLVGGIGWYLNFVSGAISLFAGVALVASYHRTRRSGGGRS